MTDRLLGILRQKLATERVVRFAYLFGSQARKDIGKLSDIDIAVFLQDSVDPFYYRLRLTERIAKAIGTEKLDIIVLNTATPLLRHQVVKTGAVLKDNKEDRTDFETKTLQEYLDTEYLRKTQLLYMRNHLRAGTFFG